MVKDECGSPVVFYGDVALRMRAYHLEQARLTGEEEEEECRRACVGRAGTTDKFLSLVQGDILIKEVPTRPHSAALGKVYAQFLAQDPEEQYIVALPEIDLISSVVHRNVQTWLCLSRATKYQIIQWWSLK